MAFKTDLLDAALEKHKYRNEQLRLVTIKQVLAWLDVHGTQYGIERAYLFGSLTRPDHFTGRSDIDIAVEKLAPDDFFQAMAALSETLEREVDLVELSKCQFAPRIRDQGLLWTKKL